MTKPVRKAVFPVAGLGTRFLPATKSIPKEILTLVDRPLIQYAIDEARAAGIEEFIFVTSRGKSSLEDYFDKSPDLETKLAERSKDKLLSTLQSTNMESGAIAYIRQTEPLGLGHAVYCTRRLIGDEPFAVILTDDLIQNDGPSGLEQMVNAYEKRGGGHMVAAMEVEGDEISAYGAIDPSGTDGNVVEARGLVEKPKPEDAPSNYAVIGRYILDPMIFEMLAKVEKGAGGEIQLTDAIDMCARTHQNVCGYIFDGKRYDCGNKAGYLAATVAFGLQNPETKEEFTKFLKDFCSEKF